MGTFSASASFDGFSSSARLVDPASSAGGAVDVASRPRGDARRGHASWEGGWGQLSPHTPPAAWFGGGGDGGHPSSEIRVPTIVASEPCNSSYVVVTFEGV